MLRVHICDDAAIAKALTTFDPEAVMRLAAESCQTAPERDPV